jgi:hypothetical protein
MVLGRALRNNVLRAKRRKKQPLTVRVVNPDDAAALTFKRLVGDDVRMEFLQTPFETYVSGLKSGAISL